MEYWQHSPMVLRRPRAHSWIRPIDAQILLLIFSSHWKR